MSYYVLKFGGSSLSNIEKINSIAQNIVKRKKSGDNLVVVVSAMGKSTNELVDLSKKISTNPCKRDMDILLSTGEQISIALLSMAVKELGEDSIALTGFQAGIKTDSQHTKARISDVEISNIKFHLSSGKIVVVAGFQGITENGDITTLGRGGSDTTAVSIAAKLGCPCEIYTDVDGIYTIDPKVFPNAKKLDYIYYEEILEMASRGAKVLETRSVELASRFKVPLYVGEAHNEKNISGTLIKGWDNNMESKIVTGFTIEENCLMVSLIDVPYIPKNIAKIFRNIADKGINVDMISQTAPYNNIINISFSSYEEEYAALKETIENLKSDIGLINYSMDPSIVKISVVGIGMVSQPGVASKLFNIFSENDIEFYQVTTSEISISYTINNEDKEKAIILIAEEFNL